MQRAIADQQEPLLILWDQLDVHGNELAFSFRIFLCLAGHSRKRRSAGCGYEQKIEAHMFPKLTQLSFYRPARGITAGMGKEQLHSSLQGSVFSGDFEKAAILEIGL